MTKSKSPKSNEFVIHVPVEYDYRFISLRRDDLFKSMKECYSLARAPPQTAATAAGPRSPRTTAAAGAGGRAAGASRPTQGPKGKGAANSGVLISGMAVRLPGGVSTLNDFWRALCDGDDLTEEVPLPPLASASVSASAASGDFVRRKGVVHGKARAGWAFASGGGGGGGGAPPPGGLTNRLPLRSLGRLSPELRCLVELAYEALADAGFEDPTALEDGHGLRTGVFVSGGSLPHLPAPLLAAAAAPGNRDAAPEAKSGRAKEAPEAAAAAKSAEAEAAGGLVGNGLDAKRAMDPAGYFALEIGFDKVKRRNAEHCG